MNVPKIILFAIIAVSMLYNGINEDNFSLKMLSFGSVFFVTLQVFSDILNWFAKSSKLKDIFIIVAFVLCLCRFGYKLSMNSAEGNKPHSKEIKLKAENEL